MFKSLKTKVIIAIFVILGLALALTSFLVRTKYEATYVSLTQSRYDYVVHNLSSMVRTGLDLKLGLDEMANLRAAADQVLKHDKRILSVEIFSADGTILYRAGKGTNNRLIPDQWRRAPRLPKSRVWRVEDGNTLVVGADIVNSIGTIAGGVALHAERANVAGAANRLGRELRHVGALIFVIGGAIAAWLTLVLLRRALRAFDRATDVLQGGAVGDPASKAELLARETADNAGAILMAVARADDAAASADESENGAGAGR